MKIVIFWLCWCTFVQSMTVNGFVNSVITTLERRYQIKSSEAGAIASLYDVGSVLVLVPLTYYGGTWRRLRVMSWGMLIMGVGCFLFALPQATSGIYSYQAAISPLCYRNTNISYTGLCNSGSETSLSNYKFVFWLAHLMVGIGAAPLYTLATAYVDENLTTENSALYLGIFYTLSLLGPAAGFLSASYFLGIYVDIGQPHPGLSVANKEIWVGAWWLCFIVSGVLALIAVVPLYGFPKELPGTNEIRAEKVSEAFGKSESSSESINMSLSDFLKNCKLIFTNPTFIFISISGTLESCFVSGLSTFGPKYAETVFSLEAAEATRLIGFILVPFGGLGMLLGGLAVRCFKLTMKGILRLQFIFAVVALPFLLIFLITCGSGTSVGGVAGVTVPYNGSEALTTVNLTATCNADCNCRSDSALFETSCGSNKLSYYSPCYAGCTTKSSEGYGNCSCVSSNITDVLTPGVCATSCTTLPYFLVVIGVIIFLVFFITTPSLTSTLRSVPEKQKTFALGVQWMVVRIFGTIPGPIVFGAMFDTACALWNQKCGVKGSCAFTKSTDIQKIILIIAFVLKTLSCASLLLAWLLYKQSPEEKTQVEHEKKGQDNPALDDTPL